MSDESEKELEQLQKLDKLRKLVQTILGGHLVLLTFIFLFVFAAVLTVVMMSVSHSPRRYLARLNLCYLPKQKGKIAHYDDKHVLGILKRQRIRHNFTKHVNTKFDEKERNSKKARQQRQAARQIMILRDRKQPHNFSILLNAATESDAVEMVNEFAQVCIQEYVRERTQDLHKWKIVLEKERVELNEKIQKCNEKISKLTSSRNIVLPEKEYERIRIQLNEFQTAKIRLHIILEKLNNHKKQLEKELSEVNPALLTHQQEIKAFQEQLEKLNNEVFTASEIYTDENPKMIAIISRRNAVQKRMDAFLKSKGIKSFDNSAITKAEKLSTEQKSLTEELEAKQSEMRVLESEIADCQRRFQLMTEYQPKLQKLTQERGSLLDSQKRLDESISEINYMLLMVNEDLFINEKATAAVGSKPFAKKKIAICVFAALVFTAFAASLIVLLEFFFGRVSNAQELQLYNEFTYLGEIPASEKIFSSKEQEKVIFNKIFHHFNSMGLHLIFTECLPGSKIIPQLFDFFEWNFAMSGQKMLLVDLVLAEQFEEPADEDCMTMIITFSKGKCYLPLTSKEFFAPTELELLKSDFQLLKQSYDYIFIRNTASLRGSILLLDQIIDICDGIMISVGQGRTPRKYMRTLLTAQNKIKLPVMTILTGFNAKKTIQDLNQEAVS